MKTHLIDSKQIYPKRLFCSRTGNAEHDLMKVDCRACLLAAFRDKQKELSEANDLIRRISKESVAIENRMNKLAASVDALLAQKKSLA